MRPGRAALIWAVLAAVIAVPVAAAAVSPLLAWREPVYIAAGFAGIAAMALMLFQPLLARGYLPGLTGHLGRQIHRAFGALLVLAVAAHVGGLWITSPPDMVDALLFRAPTWFSVWGVIAMWAVFAAALLAALRRRLRIPPRIWRRAHTAAVALAVIASVAHAMLIEGTMELVSKAVLCALVLAVTLTVVGQVWGIRRSRRA
ncbi:MAG: ferric reductase-like transmembrane domain-containing protein [Pseudomonadota bacterium]